MLAVLATLRIQEARQAEFEQLMRELAAKVRSQESGCKHYQLCRARTPGLYYMMERYADKSAFDHHMGTEYFKAAAARMASLFAGAPQIEMLEEVE